MFRKWSIIFLVLLLAMSVVGFMADNQGTTSTDDRTSVQNTFDAEEPEGENDDPDEGDDSLTEEKLPFEENPQEGSSNPEDNAVMQNNPSVKAQPDEISVDEEMPVVGEANDALPENNYRLIINGKEIVEPHYGYLDTDKQYSAVPVLLICRELGAEVVWLDEYVVQISYHDEQTLIDIRQEWFGIPLPPGCYGMTREVIDGEILMDRPSSTAIIRFQMKANIFEDFETGVITVISMD